VNEKHVKDAKSLLGEDTVDMLFRVHEDSLWILENFGVECRQPDIQKVFQRFEKDGEAIVYEDRIYLTGELIKRCLQTVPGVDDFFVPLNSFFIGGTAPYVYDDKAGKGGITPTQEHAVRIARITEETRSIKGMGRGIKLKDEILQMNIMNENCTKPLYFAVTSDTSLKRAVEIYEHRKNIMIVFCLTRPPLNAHGRDQRPILL
jgi:trimethylamine--corrinoid protein Co-methyltransferase